MSKLWSTQDSGFWVDNYIMKKVRVVSPVQDTPTGLPLHFCQILPQTVLELFIPTKHYQNMSKGIKFMECARMSTISASEEITT